MNTPAAADQPWSEDWFDALRPRQMRAWRAVEAQHVVATMRLVDSLQEQAVLEQLLESSKPAWPVAPSGAAGAHPAAPGAVPAGHYLLTTPFRYRPRHGSRFRRAGSPGLWYGAASVRTACAEVAYWRWRFLQDSSGLRQSELLTEHTLFAAQVRGPALDLEAPPWAQARARWTHALDYSATQALGEALRARPAVAWLRYASVRDPGGRCCAVFRPQALSGPDLASQQTWHCRTTATGVRMLHGEEGHEWRFDAAAAS
jgi:hypothetical protein